MWIMTPFGIIMPASPAKSSLPEGESVSDWLQVRARDRQALTYLRKNYCMGKRLGRIIYTPQRDYEYRAYCRKVDFIDAMRRVIEDIDYEKFKPQAHTESLHDLYLKIWGVVFSHYDRRVPKLRRKRWYEDD